MTSAMSVERFGHRGRPPANERRGLGAGLPALTASMESRIP